MEITKVSNENETTAISDYMVMKKRLIKLQNELTALAKQDLKNEIEEFADKARQVFSNSSKTVIITDIEGNEHDVTALEIIDSFAYLINVMM